MKYQRLLSVVFVVACGSQKDGSSAGSGATGGGSGAGLAPTKDYQCFDLPGARRDHLELLGDGKRVTFTEGRHENGAPVSDFVMLELSTGATRVLEKEASQPELVGDQPVFLRATDKSKDWVYWKRRAFVKGQPVSPEGTEVTRIAVDDASGTVYYTTYVFDSEATELAKKVQHAVWKVAPGGTPEKVREGMSLHEVIEGGKTLVGTLTGQEKGPIVKLAAAGGEPTVLVPDGALDFGIVGDKLVYLTRVGKGEQPKLMMVPLAGGPPVPVPGARDASRLLHGGSQGGVLVIDRTENDPIRLISRIDAAGLQPLAHLVGVDIERAVLLPDGVTLVALVTHDTNDDRRHDYKDENDVCLIPTAKSPSPFTPPTRKVPKRLAQAWPQLEALATGDLAGATLKYVEDDGVGAIRIEAHDTDGPAALDALLARVRDVGTKVAEAAKDPRLGTVIEWTKNDRLAAMLWDDKAGKLLPRGGAYSMMVMDGASFQLAASPKVTEGRDFSKPLPVTTVCSGTISNPGTAPIDVEVECRGWSYDKKMPDDGPSIAKKATVAAIAPGATAKYTVDLGGSKLPYHKTEQRFFVGGAEVPWFNEYAWNEAADYIATSDRVKAATGYVPKDETVPGGPLTLHAKHYDPKIKILEWGSLPAPRQAEIAKLLWDEYVGHYKRMHGGEKPYGVDIDEGSVLGRRIKNGKLEADSPYNKRLGP